MFEAEEEEKRLQELQEAAEYRQHLKDIDDTFGTPHGRRVLRWILEEGGMFGSLFVGSSEVYKRTGTYDFCLKIVNEILAADTNIYFQIIQDRVDELRIPDEQEDK